MPGIKCVSFHCLKLEKDPLLNRTSAISKQFACVCSYRCSTPESRVAAYEVLVELANGCLDNLSEICRELIDMHHQNNPETAKEWEVRHHYLS